MTHCNTNVPLRECLTHSSKSSQLPLLQAAPEEYAHIAGKLHSPIFPLIYQGILDYTSCHHSNVEAVPCAFLRVKTYSLQHLSELGNKLLSCLKKWPSWNRKNGPSPGPLRSMYASTVATGHRGPSASTIMIFIPKWLCFQLFQGHSKVGGVRLVIHGNVSKRQLLARVLAAVRWHHHLF